MIHLHSAHFRSIKETYTSLTVRAFHLAKMTSPTSFFGILPVEIFHTILHYLPLKDIAIFDTAITDSSLRSLYLATLSSLVISRYQYQSLHSSTKNPLSWIVKRQIIVNEIYSDSFHPILLHVILNSKQKLTSLEIKSSIPLEYLELIPYCPLLTKVGFAKCSDIPLRVFARFFALHPSLTTLRISQTTNSSALLKLISIISANCPNLINLDFTSSSVDHQCIEELVKGKLDLLSLNLQETRISDRSIPIILDSFPNLQTFCIHGCQISVNQVNLCCQRFIFPSLTSDDPIRISSSIQALSSNLREVQ